jgi:hypothetical protein
LPAGIYLAIKVEPDSGFCPQSVQKFSEKPQNSVRLLKIYEIRI